MNRKPWPEGKIDKNKNIMTHLQVFKIKQCITKQFEYMTRNMIYCTSLTVVYIGITCSAFLGGNPSTAVLKSSYWYNIKNTLTCNGIGHTGI